MKVNELNKRRNEVNDLGKIDISFYETLFKVYKIDKHYIYNILRKVSLPDGLLDDRYFEYIVVHTSSPWTLVSNKAYGSIKLWWLICIVNGVWNPVHNAQPGIPIRVLKSEYVGDILNTINTA
ncbi:hypothetical protein H8E06_00600 [bacterium]|nr:hypothetical protein [bacterium]